MLFKSYSFPCPSPNSPRKKMKLPQRVLQNVCHQGGDWSYVDEVAPFHSPEHEGVCDEHRVKTIDLSGDVDGRQRNCSESVLRYLQCG